MVVLTYKKIYVQSLNKAITISYGVTNENNNLQLNWPFAPCKVAAIVIDEVLALRSFSNW